eukprot:4240340-Pyramimonas_sp.AAC.1
MEAARYRIACCHAGCLQKLPNAVGRWVGVVAQGCRTEVRDFRESRGSTASVLAVVRSYVHYSAQTQCTLMLHHVNSPPNNAVDGEE